MRRFGWVVFLGGEKGVDRRSIGFVELRVFGGWF